MYVRLLGAALLLLLLRSGEEIVARAVEQGDEDDKRAPRENGDEQKGSVSFFKRALHEVKRVGAAVDPDTVADLKKAWKDIRDVTPEIQEAADGLAQAKDEVLAAVGPDTVADLKKALRDIRDMTPEVREVAGEHARAKDEISGWKKGAKDILSGVQNRGANDGARASEDGRNEGLAQLARDAATAAKGLVGDVLGDVTSEIAASLESTLSETLSEGNMREASKLWRRLLDSPGVMLIARDRTLWAGAERALRRHLLTYMSEESALEAEKMINATADYTLHFAGLGQNAAKSDYEVFQELSTKMCHLQGAAEKLWPFASSALPFLGFEKYISKAERALRANVLARLTLTVTAGALLGLNPRNDPFLMTLIASFSLGHLTKDVAINLATFFQKAVVETSPFFQQQSEGSEQEIDALDLVGELVTGTTTCHDLGDQAFRFFEVVKRAVATAPEPTSAAPASLSTSPSLGARIVPRSPTKLKMDGRVMGLTLWIASVIDRAPCDPRVLLLALILLLLCSMWGSWKLYQWGRRRKRHERRTVVSTAKQKSV